MTHRVQSAATLSSHLKSSTSRNAVALAAMFAVPMLALMPSPAQGQNICTENPPGSGVFDCSGTSDDTQVLITSVGVPAEVTLDNTATVDTTVASGSGGAAFAIGGNSGVVFAQAAGGGGLTGETNGLFIRNIGTGAVSVTVAGTATGVDENGIHALNIGTDLSIDAADTNGGQYGILASNNGAGSLTVTSAGTATGTAGVGISAFNMSAGTDLLIEAVDSTGGRSGIAADNNGTGSLTIVSTGTSEGASEDGIYAINRSAGTDLSITAFDIRGSRIGIDASNFGTGSLTITSSGTATGTNRDGIDARNYGAGLSIEAANTSGGRYGIDADNFGTGSLSITSTGTAIGMAYAGIRAHNRSTGTDLAITAADVNGGRSGIVALNDGTGALTVTSTGTVVGVVDHGIVASNRMTGATDLSVAAVDVTGGVQGIRAYNGGSGSLTITSTGTVTGVDNIGIYAVNDSRGTDLSIEAADVNGRLVAIGALNYGSGSLTIISTGTAGAVDESGIVAINENAGTDLSITAANTHGSLDGIRAENRGVGSLTIASTGTATGENRRGIVAQNGSAGTDLSIAATDTNGGEYGIYARNDGAGSLTVTSTGAAVGTSYDGIFAHNSAAGTDLSVTARDTSGGWNGISARNDGAGSLTVVSTGAAEGVDRSGIYAFTSAGGTTLSIAAVDTSGGLYGIRATNGGTGSLTITSTGTATGTVGAGMSGNVSSAGTNLSITAVDTNGGLDGIRASNSGTGSLTVISTGTATGTSRDGILAYNSSAGTDLSVAAVNTSGGEFGILTYNYGNGALTIASTGRAAGAAFDGIRAYNSSAGTDLAITAAETSGGWYGIYANNDGAGALTITSTGTATGASRAGIFARNSRAGTSLAVVADGDVTGGDDGIVARNYGSGGLTLDVTGDVAGQAGDGIRARNVGAGSLALTSSGTVTGGDHNGIYAVNSRFSADLSLTAADTSGGTTGINVRNEGAGSLTIISTGAVTGTGHTGIRASGSGTDLTIEAVDTSGALYGISTQNNGSGALTVTSTGTAIGTRSRGILATNTRYGTDLSITAVDTSGDRVGIDAQNSGTGALTVTSTGTAASASGTGINARNRNAGTDLTIVANTVTGGNDGIEASNYGTGALSITSTGTVTGTDLVGIRADNSSAGTSLTIVAGDDVTGGQDGIQARNYGTAGLMIHVADDVTGQTDDGIEALNSANDVSASTHIYQAEGTITSGAVHGITADNAGGSLTIAALGTVIGEAGHGIDATNQATATDLAITSHTARGGQSAIFADNNGSGSLTITSTGAATGVGQRGIDAHNSAAGTDLSVTAVEVIGGSDGIRASNSGTGSLTVTSTGTATGTSGLGIAAVNSNAGTDLIVTAADTSGGQQGISARNNGTGSLTVTSAGSATGTAYDGIFARNNTAGLDLTVIAADTSGGLYGVFAHNRGTGALTINSTGTAEGLDGDGIFAANSAGTDLAIAAADTNGGEYGIRVSNYGSGSLTVSTTGATTGAGSDGILARNHGTDLIIDAQGDVSGGLDAIHADNQGSGPLRITSSGAVNGGEDAIDARSAAGAIVIENDGVLGAGTGYAVIADGGATSLSNTGTINGRVLLGGLDDAVDNAGLFNATANSDFGAGSDRFVNTATVRIDGVVTFTGLERFVNDALVTMIDGAASDSLILAGDYEANSDLALDVTFNGTGSADTLVVGGAVTGGTSIIVNDISTSAGFGHAILLVDAGPGTAADAFVLDPSVAATSGFLVYDLFFDAPANDFFLGSTIGTPVFQALKFAEGAQSLWYRSADAVAAQTRSRRDASASPLWLQVYGARADRDEKVHFASAGFAQSISLDYGQDYYGAQAGYEFDLGGQGGGAVFGITGGYLNSVLGFDGSADRAEYDVFNIGAYAGVQGGNLFADALLKYDSIDGSVIAPTPGYTAELDGNAYGARLQAGYRWGGDGLFAEPAVSIEYQRTSLDDLSALGATIDYDRFEGLRGMAGLRIGRRSGIGGKNTLTYYLGGHAVHEFEGDDGLLFASGASTIAIANEPERTFGRFELGANIATPQGVAVFIEGHGDVNGGGYSGYTGYGGRAGVRLRF